MLIAMAEQGKFLEAIQEFYAEDATMQENNQPPRVGDILWDGCVPRTARPSATAPSKAGQKGAATR